MYPWGEGEGEGRLSNFETHSSFRSAPTQKKRAPPPQKKSPRPAEGRSEEGKSQRPVWARPGTRAGAAQDNYLLRSERSSAALLLVDVSLSSREWLATCRGADRSESPEANDERDEVGRIRIST